MPSPLKPDEQSRTWAVHAHPQERLMSPKRPRRSAVHILEPEDVVRLLQSEVEKAGGQNAWAKKNGLDRSRVNRVIHHAMPPTEKMLQALGLRTIVVIDRT